jgi:hypothetical protein
VKIEKSDLIKFFKSRDQQEANLHRENINWNFRRLGRIVQYQEGLGPLSVPRASHSA